MNLDLKSLAESGSFAGPPVKKEIEWDQGGKKLKATTYIRKLSYKSVMADVAAFDKHGEIAAGRIASCICDEKGEAVFTVADITGEADAARGPLDSNLTLTLLNAIAEVNGLGKKKA